MFPVITGATGAERIYDGYPDVALEMIDSRTFDGRIQLVEYRPRPQHEPWIGVLGCDLQPALAPDFQRVDHPARSAPASVSW